MDQTSRSAPYPSWYGGVGAQALPADKPFPTALSASIPEDEDSDDWEYEYSTTETEVRSRDQKHQVSTLTLDQTYYVTLDLTNPDFVKHQASTDTTTRSKTRWTNPAIGRHKRPNADAPVFKAKTFSIDPEEEQGEEVPEASTVAFQEPPKPKPVQILDLHSENPIISYDGHVYSCQWASNIGTELLFTASEGNPHPYLRTVPGDFDIDILAASSARITSKVMEIQPQSPVARPVPRPTGRKKNTIQLGSQASSKRKEQASFLEKLIKVKDDLGEEDMVTVHAQKRKLAKSWREELKAKRKKDRTTLNRLVRKGGEAREEALEKLAQLNEDEKSLLEEENKLVGSRLKSKRRPGRPKMMGDVDEPVRRRRQGKGKGVQDLLLPAAQTNSNRSVETPEPTWEATDGGEDKGAQHDGAIEISDDGGTPEGFNDTDDSMEEDGPEMQGGGIEESGEEDDANDEDAEMYD